MYKQIRKSDNMKLIADKLNFIPKVGSPNLGYLRIPHIDLSPWAWGLGPVF